MADTSPTVKPLITPPNGVAAATFKEDLMKEPYAGDTAISSYLSREVGTSLHPTESAYEAHLRIHNRLFSEMMPTKQKYDMEAQIALDAFEGIMRLSAKTSDASRVFPFVFKLVDSEMSATIASRARVAFDVEGEKSKIKWIERMYKHYTTDAEAGVDEDVVNYMWELYNCIVGWSVKRFYWETEQRIEHETNVVRDEKDDIVMDEDGFAKVEYIRKQWRKGKVKQYVCRPDEVVLDPDCYFIHGEHGAVDIAFIRDIDFNLFSQQYRGNPRYNQEIVAKVKAGVYYIPNPAAMTSPQTTNQLVFVDMKFNLGKNKVRFIEYYNVIRDEYYVMANGHPILHIPNPTPPVGGRKVLPAIDLHKHLRAGTFYSRPSSAVIEPIIVTWQRLMLAKAKRAELAASPVVTTSSTSALAPKSFRVVPGAHWKGMKGNVEILNMAGTDTGETDNYLKLLQDEAKATLGNDYERLIAEPDPTAQQQLSRDSYARLRTEHGADFREKLSYTMSAKIMLSFLMFYIPIPEIVNSEDLSEEERNELAEWDKCKEYTDPQTNKKTTTYYRYAKIPVEDKLYIERYEDSGDGTFDLVPYSGDGTDKEKAKPYFLAREQFLRTKAPVKVRIISQRKKLLNAAVRLELSERLLKMAFELPPKNADDIAKAMPAPGTPADPKNPVPSPKYYLNREFAVEEVLRNYEFDVDEATAEERGNKKIASKLIKEVLAKAPTIERGLPNGMPKPSQMMQQQLQSKVSMPMSAPSPMTVTQPFAPQATPAAQ